MGSLINSVYAVYNSGAERTAVADNEKSQEMDGLVRRDAISAETVSETLAETYRDALLEDSDDIARAGISAQMVFDGQGARWPNWMVRAGDKIVVRNLPPDMGDLDGVRRFTISRTRYDVDNDVLSLTPAELPSLELLVARSNENLV